MRRFKRLPNGFSKKIEKHAYALAIFYMHYNFCRIHSTLRVAALVKDRGIKFVPSEDDLNEIRDAGGGDDLIEAVKQAATPPK